MMTIVPGLMSENLEIRYVKMVSMMVRWRVVLGGEVLGRYINKWNLCELLEFGDAARARG